MQYKDKLDQFNQTEKYRTESEFLESLCKGRILDYGCGTGQLAQKIGAEGYDVKQYSMDFNYINTPYDLYDTVYFMHSIAHIVNIYNVLLRLRENNLFPGSRIVVITPNKTWLEQVRNESYKPDETVIEHFCQYRLEQLFIKAGFEIELQGQFGDRLGDHNERLFLVALLR